VLPQHFDAAPARENAPELLGDSNLSFTEVTDLRNCRFQRLLHDVCDTPRALKGGGFSR
jgi:hypothetical protein